MMKKLLFLIFLAINLNLKAQVDNLLEFVEIAQSPTDNLVESLSYNWIFSEPIETFKNDVIVGVYEFTTDYDEGYHEQVIKREVRINNASGVKLVSTRLRCNDKSFFEKIIEDLSDYGFKLNFKTEDGKYFYSKDDFKIIIYTDTIESLSLKKGEYIISMVKI